MRIVLAIWCSIVLATSVVIAQQEMGIEDLDLNGDGMVNKEEAASVEKLIQIFDGADLNQDGLLDQGEFDAAVTAAE